MVSKDIEKDTSKKGEVEELYRDDKQDSPPTDGGRKKVCKKKFVHTHLDIRMSRFILLLEELFIGYSSFSSYYVFRQ